MTYDFHGAWDNAPLGFNAPLFSDDNLNVDFAVNYWLKNGCPAEKLNLGLATYGRSFKLADPSKIVAKSASSGAGTNETTVI